jgi:aconitate hydratase
MTQLVDSFKTLRKLNGKSYYSLPALEEQGIGKISHLPVSVRVVIESLLRHCDGKRVKEEDVLRMVRWTPTVTSDGDVPFIVARVILQDFTGVPLLVDLAAMRDAVAKQGLSPASIEPQVPVDLVVDHSVQVDRSGTEDAFLFNLKIEFARNKERYAFLKWGQQAFKTFKVVPPGIGIVHQVNLEHIASVVTTSKTNGGEVIYPDTLVGTDSHTTMINGLGVVGWGVGGIEAEAAMLGQPVALQMPEVIGVCLSGSLQEGVTATDMTLRITEMLRAEKVVGKFVEFFGAGAGSLSVADRATIANMAPEYGATMGFFPVDNKTLDYLRMTGRSAEHIELVQKYLEAQGLFGIRNEGELQFTKTLKLDLSSIRPCVSGPKRPQDRIDLTHLQGKFRELLITPAGTGYALAEGKLHPRICVHSEGVFSLDENHDTGGKTNLDNEQPDPNWSEEEMVTNRPMTPAVISPGYSEEAASITRTEDQCDVVLTHGSIVIAAITSCTNTSNPAVMIGAGLVAKKAVERGLKVNKMIKTSLAPGSRVVTDYLNKTGLTPYLNALGFELVAYGCTTCIGNSGPLDENIERAIKDHDLVVASVLSGNRNFEARIHSSIKANFLMSPPLVVAFALAGRIDIDLDKEPLAHDSKGQPVYLRELWPTSLEIEQAIASGLHPDMFEKRYSNVTEDNPVWKEIAVTQGAQYAWDPKSTYIQEPPYFANFGLELPPLPKLNGLRCLALLGDSVTTDHISPAGAFRGESPAGQYLLAHGVAPEDFNSYGSRRGSHEVMMRGTFANVRIRNQMAEGKEGGFTKLQPDGVIMPIFDACEKYSERNVPLIVFTGKDYGMGSSRDWAAKGAALLGVKVVVARSFERIHRSNLIGMGVLPLEFQDDESHESLGIKGNEVFSLKGLEGGFEPQQQVVVEITTADGSVRNVNVRSRLDTPLEIEYYRNGGILPYVLRQLLHGQVD